MDVNKVSQTVKKDVQNIITKEDDAHNITEKEYNKLGEYLSGLKGEDEQEYVQGYIEKYKDGTLNKAISGGVKKLVKQAKKLIGKKGKKASLDNEQEARVLLSELKNGKLSKQDQEYLKYELEKAGFGYLLKELDENTEPEEPKNEEAKTDEPNPEKTDPDESKTKKPDPDESNTKKPDPDESKTKKPDPGKPDPTPEKPTPPLKEVPKPDPTPEKPTPAPVVPIPPGDRVITDPEPKPNPIYDDLIPPGLDKWFNKEPAPDPKPPVIDPGGYVRIPNPRVIGPDGK